jgi:CTP:molybdopterin cytidylyltransferase MocA
MKFLVNVPDNEIVVPTAHVEAAAQLQTLLVSEAAPGSQITVVPYDYDPLRVQLRIVRNNLRQGVSKSVQRLLARAIDEVLEENPI